MDIKKTIQAEINWCKAARGTSGKGDAFEVGFIKGLRQAILLIKTAESFGDDPFPWGRKD